MRHACLGGWGCQSSTAGTGVVLWVRLVLLVVDVTLHTTYLKWSVISFPADGTSVAACGSAYLVLPNTQLVLPNTQLILPNTQLVLPNTACVESHNCCPA